MSKPSPSLLAPRNRSRSVIQAGTIAATMLRDIGDAINAPYIKAVAGVSLLIIETVQTAKANKEKCIEMTERVYQLVCAIINICGDAKAEISPAMLRNIMNLTETLQKVLSFIRSQVDGGLLKRIARHSQDAYLLADCTSGLQHALDVFSVQSDLVAAVAVAEIQALATRRHHEILELIAAQQQGLTSSTTVSLWEGMKHSTSSISILLPPSPKIFHGRDEQLQQVVSTLSQDKPLVAILGPGGVGKSSLALAALHHADVISKFGTQRYWIPCDSANSIVDLVDTLASTFGLKSRGKSADKTVIRYLSHMSSPVLLVLDNMETPWEPLEARSQVEDYLSHLAGLKYISIMITMRGAERPAKVRWSRPFIAPLRPLDTYAARATFLDISDVAEDEPLLEEVLALTGNLPLALSLVASLAEFEGCSGVLMRWKNENISLLSDGPDKRSNLEKSITLSLLSPRITSTSGAQELLSVLAVLPDGVSDVMLEQFSLSIDELGRCKSSLFRTSLAYTDHEGRLKLLAPIREYVLKTHPPSHLSLHALRKYFFDLVKLFEKFEKAAIPGLIQKIATNWGNIRVAIQFALAEKDEDLKDAIRCLCQLTRFTIRTCIGSYSLIKSVKYLVDDLDDDDLRGTYLLALSLATGDDIDVESLRLEAIQCFERTNDIAGQARAYDQMSLYHLRSASGTQTKAYEYAKISHTLATEAHDYTRQSWALYRMGVVHNNRGETRKALACAREGRSAAQAAGDLFLEAMALREEAFITLILGNCNHAASLTREASGLLDALGLDQDCSMYREVMEVRAEIYKLKTEYAEARLIVEGLTNHNRHTGQATVWQGTAFAELAAIELALPYPSLPAIHQNIERAWNICKQNDYGFGLSWCEIVWAEYYLHINELDEAEERCHRCLAFVRGHYAEMTAIAWETLGSIAMRRHDLTGAFRHYVSYLAIAQKTEDRLRKLYGLRYMADIFLSQGDDTTASTLLELTLLDFTTMDIHKARADCMFELGGIFRKRGELVRAKRCWLEARPLFERSSQVRSVALCDENILLC